MTLSTSWTLLEQLRIRDDEGWSRFVDLYTPLILNWCHGFGLQHADSESVASDVFLAVFNQIDEFVPGGFRGWLRGITKHKAVDCIRGDVYKRTVPFLELAGSSENDHSAEDYWRETQMLYAQAMRMVCENRKYGELHWEVLEKVLIQGARPEDVAEEYGYARNSIYRMLQRVLKRLRRDFRKLIDPDEEP